MEGGELVGPETAYCRLVLKAHCGGALKGLILE